jgi:hypothetical protein
MISELIERLKTWAREAAAALKAKCTVAAHLFSHSAVPDNHVIIVASEGNVLDTGKRYRNTSGHSPLFSLFTFFANR